MKRISTEKLSTLSELSIREPAKALALLREYESEFQGDPNLAFNSGGILIDIGTYLHQPALVEEGIQSIEHVLKEVGDGSTLFYNLANGYSALSNLERRLEGTDHRFDPDNTPLIRAKHYYRKALALECADRDLRAQQWVNYGNCLSGLGRAVEAMSAYDRGLSLFPEHPMAKGNLGIELHHFARIADHPIFLIDAQRMLSEALSDKRLENYGGIEARRYFEYTRQQIATVLSELGINEDLGKDCAELPFSSDYEREYAEFCARHQLFLNFCLRCRRCDKYVRDSLTLSLITDISDDTSFVRLSRVVNEIKEQYAFARFLLFQSTRPLLNTVPIDGMTTYVDNLDYAVYGIRVASLKLAFEGAYNILDKIAHFINDYLDLGVKPGRRLTFATDGWIWHAKGGKVLRQKVAQSENWHLFGLYDLARDLDVDPKQPEHDGYWGKLRHTRNALTHEYLIPHVEGMHWTVEADAPYLHIHYMDFVEQTVALLQLVRAAIIYLTAYVDQEEHKKRQTSSDFTAPMHVNRYDAALFTPALDSWMR